MNLDIRETDAGLLLPIKVSPAARKNGICGEHAGALKVSVTQVAEKGKANKAAIALLAKQLGISKSSIEIRSGLSSSFKTVSIRGVTLQQLLQRLPSRFA